MNEEIFDREINLTLTYDEVCKVLIALNIMEYHHGSTKEERELFNRIESPIKE